MTKPLVSSVLAAKDDTSDELEIQDSDFNVAIWGVFDGTVEIQVMPVWRDVTATWVAVQSYTEPVLDISWALKGRCLVRAVCTDYNSGTMYVMLYSGEDATSRVLMTKKYI